MKTWFKQIYQRMRPLDIVGDEIGRILHSGGVQQGDVVIDTYAVLLASGRCIELTENGPILAKSKDLQPDPKFDAYIGLRIVAIESAADRPTCAIRLSDGSALVMGNPHPYYWGLHEADN